MKFPSLLTRVLVLAIGISHSLGQASICDVKLPLGDKAFKSQHYGLAQSELESAVHSCAGAGDARPYLALGKVFYELHRYPDSIAQFELALKSEPDSMLAYLDEGAAYLNLQDYDKATTIMKRGLNQPADPETRMQLNFNIGLALLKKAARDRNGAEGLAEPYFLRARDLKPDYGGNYYYLGVIQESNRHNFKSAKAGSKGMPAKSVDDVIGNVRKACSQMSQLQCKPMLTNILASVR